jgi:polyribonucleotide nucleotidyltransferase
MATTTTNEHLVSVTLGDSEIEFSTGRLAKQADGAVLVRSGETLLLATAVGRTDAREGTDFFPLTVDIEERMYAAGKIPGGFFKREGKASEKATLNARMVDRPIRPLFPKGYRNEVQVIGTVLSADRVVAHDILAINGASAALMLSPLPFMGPIGAVRIGRIEGELRVNPTMPDMQDSTLDLIVCGTSEAITMVEAGAQEVPEDVIVDALLLAHEHIRTLCDAQLDLQRQAGKAKWYDPAVKDELAERYGDRFRSILPGARPGGRRVARGRGHRRGAAARPRGRIRRGDDPPEQRPLRDAVPGRRDPRRRRAATSSSSSSATTSARCPTPSRTPRS